MSIKFLVLEGGVFWVFLGGGGADFIFMGARIFLKFTSASVSAMKCTITRRRTNVHKLMCNINLPVLFIQFFSLLFSLS